MTTWKNPPKAKVYEALSAVADGRVSIIDNSRAARVVSSGGDKSYTVTWNEDETAFGSNDNASYWQGYLGYPIIAVLFALGKLQYAPDVAKHLSNVAWKRINNAHKRNYDAAVDEVLANLKDEQRAAVGREVSRVYEELEALAIQRLAAGKPPK